MNISEKVEEQMQFWTQVSDGDRRLAAKRMQEDRDAHIRVLMEQYLEQDGEQGE